jgi:hypothetical protein
LFDEIDVNNDGVVTPDEYKGYYDTQSCQFPFIYKNYDGVTKTFTACTTEDDTFPWCSTKNDYNGVYVDRFFKYCTDEGMQYFTAWVMDQFDKNKDGDLTFAEIVESEKIQASANNFVDCGYDCSVLPDKCREPVLREDPQCQNLFKTVPLQDEELLRLLADAQLDAYFPANVLDNSVNYWTSPTLRPGSWLTAQIRSKYPYNPSDPDLIYAIQLAACLWLTELLSIETIQSLFGSFAVPSALKTAVLLGTLDLYCGSIILKNKPEQWMDGKNIVTWSLYKINKGQHKNKTILSYMGTDFFRNGEQVIIDLYGVPLNKPMAYNIIEEATKIAQEIKPDYITGHSLGVSPFNK